MKNQFLFLFVFASFSSFGQFSFGVKGGLNINDIAIRNNTSSDHVDVQKVSIGYHIGLYATLKLSEKFSLVPEIQFSQKGCNYSSNTDPYRINLNYLELPILLNYSILDRLKVELGPGFSYKTSAIAKDDGLKNHIDNLYDKNFDFGVNGGLRFEVTKRISLIGRYYYGLLPIREIEYRTVTNAPDGTIKMFNRTIQLTVSYRIK